MGRLVIASTDSIDASFYCCQPCQTLISLELVDGAPGDCDVEMIRILCRGGGSVGGDALIISHC